MPKWYAPSESKTTGNVGSNVGHDSGIKSPDADKKETGITNRPTNFKKPKEGTGGSAKDIKRAMDLVILKCKTLKIKNQLAELQDSKPHYTPEEVNEASYSNRGRNTRDSGVADMPSPNKPKKDEN